MNHAPHIEKNSLIRLLGVTKMYEQPDKYDILVLDDITLDIYPGEFVALLGPSGSGKSTLLRIITGLSRPSFGTVLYRGRPVTGPNPKAAMVFQSFALYPWLTILQNVELGLVAKGENLMERREKSLKLLDLIGLNGYEDAFPKELSGGMRQRVGFARALAVDPELLCMDEPFSALDFLTAENLRSELLDLWLESKIPTKAILMVTHGIEEAVFMADRIVILSKNPARIIADLPVPLPYPRNRKSLEFIDLVDYVYKVVTGRDDDKRSDKESDNPSAQAVLTDRATLQPIPYGHLSMLSGLLELVADRGGQDDLYHLGSELFLEVDDLLPVTETAELFHLADVKEGDLTLTDLGRQFVEADVNERKRIIREQLRDVPLFRLIDRVLRSKANHAMPKEFFNDILEEHFSVDEAERQLMTAINWGRFADLFHYDTDTELLYLALDQQEQDNNGTVPLQEK
ncbi:nitrate/sulfonate/bicarbonate ABC transporter ATP-binding protein [Sulfobacillus thermosulfidooxidans]|uniref:ABC transporter ATP-binding protein n=1 Tax=Sulfobacillus thermosulfidooxidans TaxID=28034 RepID=UPI00096B86CC|nr:nitrate/sulfonate/bicarbonate ABC transporter ATP-binding protein [Sulfobacillus thermosulfidooxidans]OLZ08796.1 nitrate ABC transporter ATP-binding protein [Sulfobacillus thermosulfidooxidans]OLZ14302.1 nitrate ABC transporter ATP-binding protein [Sulfobacillus thermosulfidooxidans]OLZ19045.1 nitrate ABC transporter ATP-binding protein [Sulfobacillus thermosulfidooxidans]